MIETDTAEVQTKLEQKKKVFQEDKELEAFIGLLKGKELLMGNDKRYNSILFKSNIPNKGTKK